MNPIDLMARPLIIAGPCSAESREQTLDTCRAVAATGRVNILRAGIWKPRTRPGSFEGIGMKGLVWMNEARQLTGLPFGVEVATPKHVEAALELGADILWIGARTTGNPFSVQDIADALRGVDIPVLVKNPLNPDLELWSGAVGRLRQAGVRQLGLIHRGFSAYASSRYRNIPMWHLAIEMRNRLPGVPMICDPSHISGKREYLRELSQQAADLAFDGLIIESHICPECALSDADQQLTPEALGELLASIVWRQSSTDSPEYLENLKELRRQIDQIDAETLELLSRRMRVAEQIGRVKRENNVAILQGGRWSSIVERVVARGSELGLSDGFLRTLLEAIHMESIELQNRIMNEQ